jgi:phage host-nuclease inhibitor protein Gam
VAKRSARQASARRGRRSERRIRDLERRLNRLTGEVVNAVVALLAEYAPADGETKKRK